LYGTIVLSFERRFLDVERGCGGLSTLYSEDGACGRGRRIRRIRKVTTAATVITATPPTVPPTIAAVFELLPLEGEGVGEEDDDNGNEVVAAGKFADDPELGPVGPKPLIVVVVVPPPINWPGPISGVSPTPIAWTESQRGKASRVTSMRAHCGTYVPCGTGFGKVPGPETVVQLIAHIIQSTHNPFWHAPHALMREYTTVLHLHMSPPPSRVGPTYSCPGRRGLRVNDGL